MTAHPKLFVVLALAVLSGGLGRAGTVNWSPPAGGDGAWGNPANWDSGQIPQNGDDVVIPGGAAIPAVFTGPPVALNSLNVRGPLEIGGSVLTVTNRTDVWSTSLTILAGGLSGGATFHSGALILGATTNAGDFILQGASTLSGDVPASVSLWVRGANQDGHATATWLGGGTNHGVIRLESVDGGWTSQMAVDTGRVVNDAGAEIRFSQGAGGSRNLDAPVENWGLVESSTNVLTTIQPPAGTNAFTMHAGEVVAGPGAELRIVNSSVTWSGGAVDGRVGAAGSTLDCSVAPAAGGGVLFAWGGNTLIAVGGTNVTIHVEGDNAFGHAVLTSATNAPVAGAVLFESTDGGWTSALNAAAGLVITPGGSLTAAGGSGGNRDMTGTIVNQGVITIGEETFTTFTGHYTGAGGVTTGPFHVLNAAVDFTASPSTPTELVLNGSGNTLGSDLPSGQTLWVQGGNFGGHAALQATIAVNNLGVLRMESVDGGWTETLSIPGDAWTNAPAGVVMVNPGTGGARNIVGNFVNLGALTVSGNIVCSVSSPSGASSTFQEVGALTVGAGGRFDFAGGLFELLGGTISGEVLTVNATNVVGPGFVVPGTLEVHGQGSILAANASAAARIWVRGGNLYGHGILNIPVNATNLGEIHLESVDGGWACDLRTQGPAVFVNAGLVSVSVGAGGERRFDGSFLNRGQIAVDLNYGMQFYGQFENNGGGVAGPATLVNPTLSVTAPASAGAPAVLNIGGLGGTLLTGNLPNTTLHLEGDNAYGHCALALPAGFVNAGRLEMVTSDGGYTVSLNPPPGAGVTTVQGGSLAVLPGAGGPRILNGPLLNQGELDLWTVLQTPGATNGPTGTIVANGGLTLNGGVLWNSGIIGFGTNFGALHVAGAFTQSAQGGLNLKIDHPLGGAGMNDQLNVDGAAQLAGSAQVLAPAGFSPATNDVFVVVTAGTRSGQFSSLGLPALPGGAFLRPAYDASSLRLSVGESALTTLQTYDPVTGFSGTNNPSGPWSYLWSTPGGALRPLTNRLANPGGAPGVFGWWDGLGVPQSVVVLRNGSGAPASYLTIQAPTNLLVMDPEAEVASVRFTTPSNGLYVVNGLFQLVDTGTRAHALAVVKNGGAALFSQDTGGQGFGAQFPFEFQPMTLAAGDTLDFLVSAENGQPDNLSTGLGVGIARVAAGTNGAAPFITRQPADVRQTNGGPVTLQVTANGGAPLGYQWYQGASPLSGATNSSLALTVNGGTVGSYTVVVGNPTGSVLSDPAVVVQLDALIPGASATTTNLPAVAGDGVAIDVYNGIGGGSPPSAGLIAGLSPSGTTLSPYIDFPNPGQVIAVGSSFDTFFANTTVPPQQIRELSAANFLLHSQFYLRVSRNLDLDPSTPEIDVGLGVGSDDGFSLTVGGQFLGNSGDRGFTYSWFQIGFAQEGLYPVDLFYDANAAGYSGLEFSWEVAASPGGVIVPQGALYTSPVQGDRLITFEEWPAGTIVTNQYADLGVQFASTPGIQITGAKPQQFVPVSPTQVYGDPSTNGAAGSVDISFQTPTGGPAVTTLVRLYLVNASGPGVDVTAFDPSGAALFTQSYQSGVGSQQAVVIQSTNIARVHVDLGAGAALAALDNLGFAAPTAYAPPPADLTVSSVSGPAVMYPGDTVTLTWVDKNLGPGTVSNLWEDQVFLVNPTTGTVLSQLGAAPAPAAAVPLPPGAAVTNTFTLVVPAPTAGTPFGSYAVRITADASQSVPELSYTNNSLAGPAFLYRDKLHLALGLTPSAIPGGGSVSASVSRDSTDASLTVMLSSGDPTHATVPATVTIPAGQGAAGFTVTTLDDGLIRPPITVAISASAPEAYAASTNLTVLGRTAPVFSLGVTPSEVGEAAGPTAALGSITGPAPALQALTFALSADVSNAVVLPPVVTLQPGRTNVTFPVGVIDDGLVTPDRVVHLEATLMVGGQTLETLGPATLTLSEADAPTLRLSLATNTVPEGASTTATLWRNTGTNGDLITVLTVDNPAKVTLPATVTITNGLDHAVFDVATVNDGLNSGDVTATLVAGATNFVSATNQLTIRNVNLPDLVAVSVTGPTNAQTGQQTTATYTISNAGVAPANGPFVIRLYLVTGPADPNPTLLNEYQFVDSLTPGGMFSLSPAFLLPTHVGAYYYQVVVDATGLVSELRKDNNTAISPAPVVVAPAYAATVRVGVTNALVGTPIVLTGSAFSPATGQPAPYVLVSIHVITAQFDRVIAALTDGNGNFSTVFQPLPTEGGYYTVTAAFPGEAVGQLPVQGAFTLIGLRASPNSVSIAANAQAPVGGQVAIVNLSAVALTGLQAQVVSDPAGFGPSLQLSGSTLPGGTNLTLGYQFNAGGALAQPEPIVLRVTSAEGATADITLNVAVTALKPQLSATPAPVTGAMLLGQARTAQFTVINSGAVASGPLTVALPPAPWLGLATTNVIPPIPPGGSNVVALTLTPSSTLPLGEFTGAILLTATNASLSVPFDFRAITDLKGDLAVTVVDEYTYYAAGAPRVTNALVSVRDSYTHQAITNGVTDATGVFAAAGLAEGYYDLDVTADKHSSFHGTVFVNAGSGNTNQVFLARQTVQFLWTVTPTNILDRTQLTIETVFETVVPIPVVTLDPTVIDLSTVTNPTTFINLTVANHGLLAAQNTRLSFPAHPLWKFTPLITDLGDLPANSSLVVPVRIDWLGDGPPGSMARRAGGGAQPKGNGNTGPCSTAAQVLWTLLCGPNTNTYSSGVQIINAAYGCVGGGGGGAVAGGGGGGGGAYYNLGLPSLSPPTVCSCDYFPKICIGGEAAIKFDGLADALASQLLKLLPNFSVFDKEVSLSISGQLCTCCESNQVSYTAAGNGTATLKIVLRGGFTPSGKLSADTGTWKNVNVSGDFLVGAEATIQANVNVGLNKECLGEPQICVNGSASLTVFGGSKGSAKVSATDTVTGLSFSGGGSFAVGAQGTGSATISWCSGQGGKISLCGKVELIANVSGSLSAKDPATGLDVSKDFTANDDEVVAQAGDCGGPGVIVEGGRTIARAKDISDYIFSPDELLAPENQILAALGVANSHPGICAQVRLRLDQDALLTRSAFNATLEVLDTDSAPLDNFRVEVHAMNADGSNADSLFGIEPPVLSGLPAIDGSASVDGGSQGTASWTLIPTIDAAPQAPTQFLIGGAVHYTQNGTAIDQPLASVPVTVYPSPILSVQYFHQRDVFSDDPFTPQIEPSIPFDLAVFVQNKGHGTAHDFSIVSSQPQIVDNQKGLLVSFQIIGTEVEGKNLTPSLTADFGDLDPGTNAIGVWFLTSTIQGLFVDYSASFKHVDDLGNPRLSLIQEASIHEMIHLVQAGGAFEDGRPDFLVNDNPNYPEGLPDKLYLSDGTTNDVTAVLTNSIDGPPSAAKLQVTLTAPMPAGWGFLQAPEPSDGTMHLARIVRSDGEELPIDKAFWTTDRTFIGMGQRPLYQNLLHLLDYGGTGQYTLYYESITNPPTGTPISTVGALAATSPATFPVHWSGSDGNGGGIAFYDVFVSIDGGAFQPWITNTTLLGAVYAGSVGHTYGFYSVATDVAGAREQDPNEAQARTTVVYQGAGPVIAPVPNQTTLIGASVGPIPVGVGEPGLPAAQLTVSAASSNPALLPPANILITGSGTNRALTLTPAAGLVGAATVTLTVSDGVSAASTQFTLSVTRPTQPPITTPATFGYHAFQEADLSVAQVLAFATDPNGLPLSLVSVSSTSTNGAKVAVSKTQAGQPVAITYSPTKASAVADQFTYVVGNGILTATGVVNMAPTPLPAPPINSLASTINTDGSVHLEFLGVAGQPYDIEYATTLDGSAWRVLGTRTADPSGLIRYDDGTPGTTKVGFYRAATHGP